MSAPKNPRLFCPWDVDLRSDSRHYTEITLRDLFAAAALCGYIATSTRDGEQARGDVDKAAAWAYENADAMLAARESK